LETVYALIRYCLKKHGITEPPIVGNIEPSNKWLMGRLSISRNTLHIFGACSTLIGRAIHTYWQAGALKVCKEFAPCAVLGAGFTRAAPPGTAA
jgi:hypothetical protein